MDYSKKYLKYKEKYLKLSGGTGLEEKAEVREARKVLDSIYEPIIKLLQIQKEYLESINALNERYRILIPSIYHDPSATKMYENSMKLYEDYTKLRDSLPDSVTSTISKLDKPIRNSKFVKNTEQTEFN
jgi:hypothetical protein